MVTLETFMNWKQKFDRELLEMKKEQKSNIKDTKKLTGEYIYYTNIVTIYSFQPFNVLKLNSLIRLIILYFKRMILPSR